MSRQKTTGSRYRLGEPYEGMLTDFRDAVYKAPEIEIIREAVKAHIERVLGENPGLRAKYDAARADRLGAADRIVPLKQVRD